MNFTDSLQMKLLWEQINNFMHEGTSNSLENKFHSNGYRLAAMKIHTILSMKIKFILVEWSTEYEAGKVSSEIY